MSYACPVCEDPQADGEHLANHLAFSALLGRADHESWLDEHAPGWDDNSPTELAERVTPHVEEVEYADAVATPPADGPELTPQDPEAFATGPSPRPGSSSLDPATRQVIEEARELTRRRHEDAQPEAEDRTTPESGDEAPDDGSGK